MLLNLVRYLVLYSALHKFLGWTVRWNRGLPTATSKAGELIYLRYDQWVVDRSDEYPWEETYQTLWAVFSFEVPARLEYVCGPLRSSHRLMLGIRGAVSLRVLLLALRDPGPWTKSIWSTSTHTETTYKNASGWHVKHYSDGGIFATNTRTKATITYHCAGHFGYWHVKSAFNASRVSDPNEERRYPLGKHTVFMLVALLGISPQTPN